MNDIKLTSGVKYKVVGRYTSGSTVSAYHIVGDDGTQKKVNKAFLIRLIDKGLVTNCRVQMYNGEPIIRGNGINMNSLPVYDEQKKEMKIVRQEVSTEAGTGNARSDLPNVMITKRIMDRSTCLGYEVVNESGESKLFKRDTVIEIALQKQIVNARVQRDGNNMILRGVGCSLDKLPVINASELRLSGNQEQKKETGNVYVGAVIKEPTNINKNKKNIPLIEVTLEEIIRLGSRKFNLRKDISKASRETGRLTNIKDVQEGKARLYIQAFINNKGGEYSSIEEFITTVVKFGETEGIVMRVTNRNTGDTFDIRQSTLEKEKINEKVCLAVMCCGIKSRYSISDYGLISIQMKDASSERAYQIE